MSILYYNYIINYDDIVRNKKKKEQIIMLEEKLTENV